jgi:hypothetical protein
MLMSGRSASGVANTDNTASPSDSTTSISMVVTTAWSEVDADSTTLAAASAPASLRLSPWPIDGTDLALMVSVYGE